ncbi:hypothetical protein [Fusibacter sp. JL216-2]|uniref:hypothetical protein n=1 Tax=Fusibacter sp. JL216-2 TaxID=3071453 RepID=UPI003D34E7CC
MKNLNEEQGANLIKETPEAYDACIICNSNSKVVSFKDKRICRSCISSAILLK